MPFRAPQARSETGLEQVEEPATGLAKTKEAGRYRKQAEAPPAGGGAYDIPASSSAADHFVLGVQGAAKADSGHPESVDQKTGPQATPPAGTSRQSGGDRQSNVPVQNLAGRPFRLRAMLSGAGVPPAAPPPVGGTGVANLSAPLSDAPAALTQLDVDMTGNLKLDAMLVGAYRIQISTSADFAARLFDKTYDFMEDADVFGDIAALDLRRGTYWVRYAFLDLLGGELPFSKPRAYAYRPPIKKSAAGQRSGKMSK